MGQLGQNSPPLRPPRPPDPVYRVYIDESGDHTYSRLDEPWRCHLALLGIWLKRGDEYNAFSDALVRLKRDVFHISPDDRLVFHLSEIKGRKGAFGALNDPATDALFGKRLLELIESTPFTMVCAIIDKAAHQKRYAMPFHPYHFAMTALSERYAFWLSEKHTRGDAVAESRGKKEDKELGDTYRNLATKGTSYLKDTVARRVLTSKELKFKCKDDDVPGLQLADMLVHPMKRDALIEAGLCENRGGFAREMAAAARPKYRDCYKGTVSGRGRVWIKP